LEPLKRIFSSHPRRWRQFRYVYPVISRRSGGLSIGINLTPDATCNFNCVYCCADRSVPRRVAPLDLDVLEAELRDMVAKRAQLFSEPEFQQVPAELRRLNDIAFSGDGEPTIVPAFGNALGRVAQVRRDFGLDDVKIVLITNACCLTRSAVVAALVQLDQSNGEIWAKLDAGSEEYFRIVSRAHVPFQQVVDGILATARVRPIVLQSLFMRLNEQPPTAAERTAYVELVRWLLAQGAQFKLVQIYTVARRTAEDFVAPLSAVDLEALAARVRDLGVAVRAYA